MTTRSLRIYNGYVDGDEVVTHATLDIDGDRSAKTMTVGCEDPCAIDELVDWFYAGWTVGRAVAEIHRRALAQVS